LVVAQRSLSRSTISICWTAYRRARWHTACMHKRWGVSVGNLGALSRTNQTQRTGPGSVVTDFKIAGAPAALERRLERRDQVPAGPPARRRWPPQRQLDVGCEYRYACSLTTLTSKSALFVSVCCCVMSLIGSFSSPTAERKQGGSRSCQHRGGQHTPGVSSICVPLPTLGASPRVSMSLLQATLFQAAATLTALSWCHSPQCLDLPAHCANAARTQGTDCFQLALTGSLLLRCAQHTGE
jgi:hypothetical protein